MTSVDEILERLIPLVGEHLDVDQDQIVWGTNLMDLGVDKMAIVEFMTFLEDEFGICFPDKNAMKLTKISELVQYIAMRIA